MSVTPDRKTPKTVQTAKASRKMIEFKQASKQANTLTCMKEQTQKDIKKYTGIKDSNVTSVQCLQKSLSNHLKSKILFV